MQMISARDRDCFVRLNVDIRSDLQWWHKFMEQWNDIGLLLSPDREVVILPQATGAVGRSIAPTAAGFSGSGTMSQDNGILFKKNCYPSC